MNIRSLKLPGTFEIELHPKCDERGYFLRAYDEAIFSETGLNTHWVQENEARSVQKDIVRGLHFQKPPYAETKLIRVVKGAILDAFVDLRRSSPTFGQWEMVEISEENHKAVYVPKGFAHGYCTLTDLSVVVYKVDAPYANGAEGGLRWNDSSLAIPWPVHHPVLSLKDSRWPELRDFVTPFD
jgi:dTDP-4-dehydrorhamnose 3,5-epimerase